MKKTSAYWVSLGLSSVILTACGGSSDSASEPDDGNTGTPPPSNYTVSAEAGTGGSIDPTSVTVTEGDTTTFSVTPDDGFEIDSVSGCNGSLSGTDYTTGAITADCTVEATFSEVPEPESYEVTTQMNLYGEISPESQTVTHGDTAEFTVTPNEGYAITEVTGCDGTLSENTYTTGPVTKACEIAASFEEVAVETLEAPADLVATAQESSIQYTWSAVEQAQTYHLFYDVEPGIDPENYAANGTGEMVADVTSPYTLGNLDNGTTYYAVVVASDGEQESAPSNEVNATPQAMNESTIPMNDTGATKCWVGNPDTLFWELDSDCPVEGVPDQDAEFGRDALAAKGELEKVGAGKGGFDFTKIGSDGEPLAIQDAEFDQFGSEAEGTQWSCVQDNHTGLLWEVKQFSDDNWRAPGQEFNWYTSNWNETGESLGIPSDESCSLPRGICDTESYVNEVNSEGLCGRNDWRLPTAKERVSISVWQSSSRLPEGFFIQSGGSWVSTTANQRLSTGITNNVVPLWASRSVAFTFSNNPFEDIQVRLVTKPNQESESQGDKQ